MSPKALSRLALADALTVFVVPVVCEMLPMPLLPFSSVWKPWSREEVQASIRPVIAELPVDRQPAERRESAFQTALRAGALALTIFRFQHVQRILFAAFRIGLVDVGHTVRIFLPQIDVRGLVDQVEERVAEQFLPIGAAVIAAEGDLQPVGRLVIEVERMSFWLNRPLFSTTPSSRVLTSERNQLVRALFCAMLNEFLLN